MGGVCSYEVVDQGIVGDWIADCVTPNIKAVYGTALAKLFGKAILWLCSSESQGMVPPEMLQRVKEAYAERSTLPDGTNPVEKRLQLVTGRNAQVFITAVEAPDGTGDAPPTNGGGGTVGLNPDNDAILMTVLGQGNRQQQTLHNMMAELESMQAEQRKLTRMMVRLQQTIDRNPLQMLNTAAQHRNMAAAPEVQVANTHSNATLAPGLRTLEAIWLEYTTGIGGRKPAKDFTRAERGRDKYKYSRRKVVWDLISLHANAGRRPSQVIQDLHTVYGANASCTRIIF